MKKVMLADDEEAILALLKATLGYSERYRLLLASDGEQALRLAQAERPDLLFLDILLPKRDGFEVCRELKADAQTRQIKIVMLTALAQESDRQQALAAGADGYLTKPFSPMALLEEVEDLLA